MAESKSVPFDALATHQGVRQRSLKPGLQYDADDARGDAREDAGEDAG